MPLNSSRLSPEARRLKPYRTRANGQRNFNDWCKREWKGNMPEVDTIHLSIRNGTVHVDIRVSQQWRRVINTYHASITEYTVCAPGLELGGETTDVTAEYQ